MSNGLMTILLGIGAIAASGFMFTSSQFSNNLFSLDDSLNTVEATGGNTHTILLSAQLLPNGQIAYKMEEHLIDDGMSITDVTNRYSGQPSVPGPTIVLDEGDDVMISVRNDVAGAEMMAHNRVSLHVHGVHYTIMSDGTLEHVNMLEDQGASPGQTRQFHWVAGPGTAGTWPYHDHTFGGINGAEHKGLFGAVIVNPSSGHVKTLDGNSLDDIAVADIKKEFVLYLGDDAFWGMEIDTDGNQTPLWVNPTLNAKTGDPVRFHLIALGTDIHKFQMSKYQWAYPGTSDKINSVEIGPLENHQFTVTTKNGNANYVDKNPSNHLMGMTGTFVGSASGGPSIPGPSPLGGP